MDVAIGCEQTVVNWENSQKWLF